MLYGPDGKRIVSSVNGDTTEVQSISAEAVDPLLRAAAQKWDDLAYLFELHENFLAAIQKGQGKELLYKTERDFILAGSPKWSQSDTFDSWVSASLRELDFRLEELKVKLTKGTPANSNIISLLESGEMKDVQPLVGHELDMTDAEIYVYIIRKSQEAIKLYRSGAYTLKDVVRYEGS